MLFGEKLRELKDKADDGRGISEAKLSKQSGVPLGALHSYLLPPSSTGHRKPSLENAAKLAKALGITCNEFTDCEDVAGETESAKKASTPKRTAKGRGPKQK